METVKSVSFFWLPTGFSVLLPRSDHVIQIIIKFPDKPINDMAFSIALLLDQTSAIVCKSEKKAEMSAMLLATGY